MSDIYRLVSKNDGTDYDISPNLSTRFNFGGTSLQLLNYIGNEIDITVYIRGASTGNKSAYQRLDISYIQNKSPIVSGDIQNNKVEVLEDDDNVGQT